MSDDDENKDDDSVIPHIPNIPMDSEVDGDDDDDDDDAEPINADEV